MTKQQETKYTVYEIEKLTGGKLTKYKLTKAIHAGELNALKVNEEKKRGRGIPNYFIYESELNNYLSKLEEKRKNFINVPDNPIETNQTKQSKEDKILNLLEETIERLSALTLRLDKFEQNYTTVIPMLKNDTEQQKNLACKEIIDELATMPSFQVQRRKELLNQLKTIV